MSFEFVLSVFAKYCSHDKHKQAVEIQHDMVEGVDGITGIVAPEERLVAPADDEDADKVGYVGADKHLLCTHLVE